METHIGKGVGQYLQKELESAYEQILISTPLISYSLAEKLVEFARKGIRIRIITSETNVSDYSKAIEYLRRFSKKSEMSEHNTFQFKIVSSHEVSLIHAKIYIIDDKCAITGSVNLTEDSFFNYPEYAVITRESNKISQIRSDFEKLWNMYTDMPMKTIANKKIRKLIRNLISKL